jgi:hypothetical protein
MTKQEVLQGALALNGSDKDYTVTVKGNKIIIESRYRGAYMRETKFRCIARLRDDATYTETNYSSDGRYIQYGRLSTRTVSYSLDGSVRTFEAEEIKTVLRDYLAKCGYRKTKNYFLLALSTLVPAVFVASTLIGIIISWSSVSDFVDTNGPENFALTEITRDDIVSSANNYKSFLITGRNSGYHTNVTGATLREKDYDHVRKSFGKIHGVIILQATQISGDTLTLRIDSSVESGNAEIVIVVDEEYYCSVAVNQTQFVTLQGIAGKEIVVKLAGENAKMKIEITREY